MKQEKWPKILWDFSDLVPLDVVSQVILNYGGCLNKSLYIFKHLQKDNPATSNIVRGGYDQHRF